MSSVIAPMSPNGMYAFPYAGCDAPFLLRRLRNNLVATNKTMKNFLVFLRDGNAVTVKADSIAKTTDGMVFLQNGQGETVAAFTIAEISGLALEESVVSE